MILLLLFIFMNSCHLAQCEMMGHSRTTGRAGSEFKISLLPLLIQRLDPLNMDGSGRMGLGKTGMMMQGKNIVLTEG